MLLKLSSANALRHFGQARSVVMLLAVFVCGLAAHPASLVAQVPAAAGNPADASQTTEASEAAQSAETSAGEDSAESTAVDSAQNAGTQGTGTQGTGMMPLAAAGLGVFVVLALMIGLKTHAFIALILGALTISCFVPQDVVGFVKSPEPKVIKDADKAAPSQIVKRVSSSLGNAVSGIGILIAMAAIIGKCMLVSGAADRIVKSTTDLLGEKRAALAMMISGFILSIPVFFDTVFYLLVPLARSLYRRTGKNYLLYLGAIAAGGAITHTLVPPTPGPLLVVDALKLDVGPVILIGLMIGAPSAVVGLLAASWLNKTMPIEMRPMAGGAKEVTEFERLPSLPMALAPVVLPVILITVATVYSTVTKERKPDTAAATQVASADVDSADGDSADGIAVLAGEQAGEPKKKKDVVKGWLDLVGNPNLAMIIAAIFAIYLCWKVQGHSLPQLAENIEDALLSGGVIILITAAGGAFGALLAMTEIQNVVQGLFSSDAGEAGTSGLAVIFVAYALAAILKVAQGSSTVSMIISSSLVASIALPLIAADKLGFHAAYLVPVIGAGSLMGSWMNDSGFWVFAKMGVLTEKETLRSWTVLLSILSLSGFLITLLLVTVLPFPFAQ